MFENNNVLFLLCSGILAVTFIDTVGAIASRKFNFKYSWLAILSFAVYILIGFFGSKHLGSSGAIGIAILIGIYDAVVGFWLSIKLRANMGIASEEIKKIRGIHAIVIMTMTSLIFSSIGYALSQV